MKTVVIGDIHGRTTWKEIIKNNPDAYNFVFIGDYFDSRDIKATQQINNFLDIIESNHNIIMLTGNHDHHYFKSIGNTGTSGYQNKHARIIGEILEKYNDRLQMAHSIDNILFTHAGVSEVWLDSQSIKTTDISTIRQGINAIWYTTPKSFIFSGTEPHGENMQQTPIWIRPRSLMKASKNLKEAGIIQVVGHTQMKFIDIEGKSTGGHYYFIDALGSGEYLIIEDGNFSLGKL